MHVGLKPLDARGEYLVGLLEDGYPTQFTGRSPDGVWLFRGDFPQALERYQGRLAAVEPQWADHVEAQLLE
jgi:hypothetical protein